MLVSIWTLLFCVGWMILGEKLKAINLGVFIFSGGIFVIILNLVIDMERKKKGR